tara:strand:- start:765 stop:1301 length:537 start_codon:yes stop_codon:yes gene_type:complete
MSTSITTHTTASLNELTLATITAINNHFANMVGSKITKRFGTKPVAIKKCLINQAEFNSQFPSKETIEKVVKKVVDEVVKEELEAQVVEIPVAKSTKEKESRFDMSAILTCVGVTTAKEGSIEWLIVEAITHAGIVQDVVARIVGNYERPRSEKNVDTAFAIRKIKRLIKKGRVTLTK